MTTEASTPIDRPRPPVPSPVAPGRPRLGELVSPQLRILTVGLFLLLGANAFEIVGSATAMPAVLDDLGGVGAYGWAVAAPLVASVLAAPFGGRLADRWGTLRPLVVTLVLFGCGLVAAALAPTMALVALGRFVQGLGAGASMTLQLVIIARYVPLRLRPLMLGAISAVFIVPGLIGPVVSAAVADTVGWRWIFGGILPVVVLCGALLVPELVRRPPLEEGEEGSAATGPDAPWWGPVLLSGGIGVAVVAGSAVSPLLLVAAGAGVVLAVLGGRATMPAGTWRAAPGLPAAVACALGISLAYLTSESFLPLVLRELRGQSLLRAGLPLTAAAFFWSFGAWYQARLAPARRPAVAAAGGLVSAVGLLLASALVLDPVPFWLAYPATALGSFGCGLAFTICQAVAVEVARPGREGEATAGVQLANLLGAAVGTSATAVMIAHLQDHLAGAVGVAFVVAAGCALVAAGVARRLPVATQTVVREGV